MKSLASFILPVLLLCVRVDAQQNPLTSWQNPPSEAYWQNYQVITNLSGVSTNPVATSLPVDANLYHTVNAIVTVSTNGFSFAMDTSLDSTNYVLGTTNLVTATAGAATLKVTLVEKEAYLRFRIFATNSTASITYLGGR
jgi:hypothetical protein